MIEKCQAYKVGEQFFPCIEDAQIHEMTMVLHGLDDGAVATDNATRAAQIIIANKERVLDILTMRPNSKPRARKINGGRKARAAKPAPAAAGDDAR